MFRVCFWIAIATTVLLASDLDQARDQQDRTALDRISKELAAAAQRAPNDAEAQDRFALAQSYRAEVATEAHDKAQAANAAEAGIRAAEKAVALKPDVAEYHRLLGTLCGQVIPANVIAGLKYGRCALDSVNKAIQMDPKSARNYLSRGVGYYYLPPSFGGGVELAIKDFDKAIQIDPKFADAYLWLGIALRKENHNAEARKTLQKALELNPNRVWTRQQLDKTPAQ